MAAKTVWKFPVPLMDHFTINMPREAKPLTVAMQRDEPQVWVLVDPSLSPAERHFRVAGTGHWIEDGIKAYVGSFQLQGGALVFHLFEVEAP